MRRCLASPCMLHRDRLDPFDRALWLETSRRRDRQMGRRRHVRLDLTLRFCVRRCAVRLWFNRLRGISVFIGLIAALAFIVTFTNSLGGIASRADKVEAQRSRILDARSDDRRELERLEKQLADLGNYAPTDQAAVDAAKRAADAATTAKERECGNGDPKQRGKFCREKEESERAAADALRKATAEKATTDRASKIEGDIRALRDRLYAGETVASANPLGNALSLLIGSAADVLTARLQAIIALVFELCLVGLMVSYEALGHKSEPERARVAIPPRPKPQLIASNPSPPVGSVKRILTDNLDHSPGRKVEIAELGKRYRDVCKAEGKCAVSQDAFVADFGAFCDAVGIKRKMVGDHLYLIDVQLTQLRNGSITAATEVKRTATSSSGRRDPEPPLSAL